MHPVLFPPVGYGMVHGQLHRSDAPGKNSFSFLNTLNLKCITVVGEGEVPESIKSYCEDSGAALRIVVPPNESTVDESAVIGALKLVTEESLHPMLVCDSAGGHTLAAIIGCIRKLQGWPIFSALEEYRRHVGVSRTWPLVEEFIEVFDPDIVSLTPEARSWLQPS